jgi:hypothetical protein
MKWIVTLSDGKEVEETGGSARDAATNAARIELGEPNTAGIRVEYKVRRKTQNNAPQEVVKLVTRCYWGTDW